MKHTRQVTTPVQVPGAAIVPISAAAALAGMAATGVLAEHGLVTGDPVVLGVLLGVIVLTGTRRVQAFVGRGRLDTRATTRLTLAFVLFAALTWTAGWSFVLPAAAVLVGVVHIQRSGPSVWLPAALVVTAFTLAGQVGVALGWVGTVAAPVVSHLAAGILLVLSCSGIVVAASAVAERDSAQRTRERAEARLRALLDSSQDVLSVSDASGVLTYVSPASVRGLGHEPHALVGTPLLDLVDAEHRARVAAALEGVLAAGPDARTSIDVLVELASHERRWFAWAVHNLLDDPLVAGLVLVQSDITDRLRHQAELAHAATHDDLTGLPNRSDLLARIDEAGAQAVAGAGIAVLFLDLDRFKQVNDVHGHPAGDELLVTIARRLRAALRPHDHLARISGDEFCAVLTEVRDAAEVDGIVQRLHTVAGDPVALRSGAHVSVGVSVGRALAFGPSSAEELLRAADTAMYRDKRARRRAAHPGAHAAPVRGGTHGPRAGTPTPDSTPA